MKARYFIKTLNKIQKAPTQYRGTLVDGRNIAVSYEHGKVEIWVSNQVEGKPEAGRKVFESEYGEPFDCHLELRDLRLMTTHLINYRYLDNGSVRSVV